jgi:hypothetical protein
LRIRIARSPVPELWLWSRAAVWILALFAIAMFVPNRNPLAVLWDDPSVTHDLGPITDVWARWDSVFFLRVAEHGYDAIAGKAAPAFYPLYPALVAGAGRALGGHFVLGGIVVSLAASLGAFFLLHRVAEERLGVDGARRAVLYLAIFPTSFFLQAVYSESVYLLLALGAFLLAERRRYASAGAAAGLAMLSRPMGAALVPALALIAWRERERLRPLAGLALAPLLFLLYPLWLWIDTGHPWAFANTEKLWGRHLSPYGPFAGIWNGLRAGWAGVEQYVAGAQGHVYWHSSHDPDPIRVATTNLETLAFLVLFIGLTVVVWRRFGAPYGLFATLSLALPLSTPSRAWPLLSMPRFGLVVFPFFLALASLGGRPRVHTAIVALSSMLLGVFVVQWALWQWVA